MAKNIFIVLLIMATIYGCHHTSDLNSAINIKNQLLISLDGDTIPLRKAITNKKLIFRYSVLSCKSCVDSILLQLRKYENKLGIEKIMVFTYYQNLRHFVISARLNRINYKIYQVPKNNLFIEQDSLRIPYFFKIDSNLVVSDKFLIYNYYSQKGDIDKYLSTIQL